VHCHLRCSRQSVQSPNITHIRVNSTSFALLQSLQAVDAFGIWTCGERGKTERFGPAGVVFSPMHIDFGGVADSSIDPRGSSPKMHSCGGSKTSLEHRRRSQASSHRPEHQHLEESAEGREAASARRLCSALHPRHCH
jgi:hypothetical protein